MNSLHKGSGNVSNLSSDHDEVNESARLTAKCAHSSPGKVIARIVSGWFKTESVAPLFYYTFS